MTNDAGLGRPLSSWLEDEAAMHAPDDLLPAVLDQAARTRRRPAWATPERWISMETRAQLGTVSRAAVIVIGVVSLIAVFGATTYTAGAGGSLDPTGPAGNGLIAFTEADDIWVVQPDGSGRHQLTEGPAIDQSPTWSRDGTRLAYWTQDEAGGPTRLVVMDADGTDPVTVLTDEAGRTSLPVDWSPDGTSVALVLCDEGDVCSDFVTAATDGSGATRIGNASLHGFILRWSPDGTRLAFGGAPDGEERGIYVMATDDTDIRRVSQVTSTEENHFSGLDWAPDGSSIVTHAGPSPPDVHVIGADGSSDELLAEGGYLPRWSPDGAWVAYTMEQGGQVAIVPAEGGDPVPVGASASYRITWAPDGSALVLQHPSGIAIVDVPSGEVRLEIPGVGGDISWQRVAS
jgi:Tol biopolymer transport system component